MSKQRYIVVLIGGDYNNLTAIKAVVSKFSKDGDMVVLHESADGEIAKELERVITPNPFLDFAKEFGSYVIAFARCDDEAFALLEEYGDRGKQRVIMVIG